jgi:hypothetical protein
MNLMSIHYTLICGGGGVVGVHMIWLSTSPLSAKAEDYLHYPKNI